MGINYTQYCIVGMSYNVDDIKVIQSPKVTEKHPRYDTKTGRIKDYETVTVKEEESYYKLFDKVVDHPDEFDFEDMGLDCFYVDGELYVGKQIEADSGSDRVELIHTEIDRVNLAIMFDYFKKATGEVARLIFVSYVG